LRLQPGQRFFRCGHGPNFEIFQWEPADGQAPQPRNSDIGGHHLAFYVDDLDSAVAHLLEHGVTVLVDAAESLGARLAGAPAGSHGHAAAPSFNGNKIITTSGGGALVTDDGGLADHVRHLATQAREPVSHYEHTEVGFNHRLSNLLAALGVAQLAGLDERVARRRAINAAYAVGLGDLPGVTMMPHETEDEQAHGTLPSMWLTCLTIDPAIAGTDRDTVIAALVAEGIEARPVWKPMHLQPVHANAPLVGTGAASARLFDQGIALPSGSTLTDAELDEVIARVRACWC
jgi:dTDP-4-amino-4,6-dideoxygalactose transaminase